METGELDCLQISIPSAGDANSASTPVQLPAGLHRLSKNDMSTQGQSLREREAHSKLDCGTNSSCELQTPTQQVIHVLKHPFTNQRWNISDRGFPRLAGQRDHPRPSKSISQRLRPGFYRCSKGYFDAWPLWETNDLEQSFPKFKVLMDPMGTMAKCKF